MKKILMISLCLVLFLSFVSAGFFGDLFTGKAIREATLTEDSKIIETTSDSITLKEGTKVIAGDYEISQVYATEDSVRIVVKYQEEKERITVEKGGTATLPGGEMIEVIGLKPGGFVGKDEANIIIRKTPEKEPQPIEPFKEEVVPGIIGFGEKSKELEKLTSDLLDLSKEYSETSPFRFAKKRNILNELEEMVREREIEMIKLAKKDPRLFLQRAMSDKEIDLLPNKIRNLIEQEVFVKGDLYSMIIEDFSDFNNPISSFEHFIITKDNKRIDFYPAKKLGLIPQAKVEVLGFEISKIVVGSVKKIEIQKKLTPIKLPFTPIPQTAICTDSDDGKDFYTKGTITVNGRTEIDSCNADGTLREWFCGTPGDPAGLLRSENFVSCGEGSSCLEGVCSKEHKMAVLLIDFDDSSASPFTPTEAYDLIFNGPFQNFYRENSYNRIHFTGDIFGWFTLPRNSGDSPGCYPSIGNPGWEGELDSYLNQIDFNNYDHLVIFINGINCNGGGWSTLGPGLSIMNNQHYYFSTLLFMADGLTYFDSHPQMPTITNAEKLLIHEMGHSLGSPHATGYDCDDAILGFECVHIEYGNYFDVMSSIPLYSFHFNSINKEHLEWFLPQEILTITQSGTYTLNTFEILGGKKFAKIQLLGSDLFPYYLEYRKGIGFDSKLNDPDLISNQNGLLIYKKYPYPTPYPGGGGGFISRFLDMNPTLLEWQEDIKEAVLIGNNVFYDSSTGITIGPILSSTANSITFNVDIQQTICSYENPAIISFLWQDTYNFEAGAIVDIPFVFRNNDYPLCQKSDLMITLESIPSGFSVSEWFEPNILNVFPQEDIIMPGIVLETSPTVCTGSYPISFTIENLNSGLTTTETIIVDIDGASCPQISPPAEL